MKIYRLEHPKFHRGPHTAVNYSADSQAAWDLAGASPGAATDNRPSPSCDLGFGWEWQDALCRRFCCVPEDIKFGCDSLEALKNWFDGELFDLLLQAGHEISIYDVPEEFVHCGARQVCFRKVS